MASKRPPPLTPADAEYLGMDKDATHALRWRSQSRDGVAHTTHGNAAGGWRCTCEAYQWSLVGDGPPGCKHCDAFADALAHHLDPPPADPGGAGLPKPLARLEPPWPGIPGAGRLFDPSYDSDGPPDQDDPGGAALDAAQGALDGETADWRDELPRNFGTVAVTPELLERAFGAQGAPPLAAVAVSAWGNLPATLDEAVADDGDRWIQSRAAAGIRLTCTACHDVRGWATEAEAVDWLARDGRCGCGGGAPTPPAPGAGRKPLSEHLGALYGDS
jgi:hypothetical protein